MFISDVINPWLPTPVKKRKISGGRPKEDFSNVSPQSQKNRLDPAYTQLKTICETEKVPFNEALGKLGARFYHNEDLNLKRLFAVIASGVNPLEKKIVDEKT